MSWSAVRGAGGTVLKEGGCGEELRGAPREVATRRASWCLTGRFPLSQRSTADLSLTHVLEDKRSHVPGRQPPGVLLVGRARSWAIWQKGISHASLIIHPAGLPAPVLLPSPSLSRNLPFTCALAEPIFFFQLHSDPRF